MTCQANEHVKCEDTTDIEKRAPSWQPPVPAHPLLAMAADAPQQEQVGDLHMRTPFDANAGRVPQKPTAKVQMVFRTW